MEQPLPEERHRRIEEVIQTHGVEGFSSGLTTPAAVEADNARVPIEPTRRRAIIDDHASKVTMGIDLLVSDALTVAARG